MPTSEKAVKGMNTLFLTTMMTYSMFVLLIWSGSAPTQDLNPTEPKPTVELRVRVNNQVSEPDQVVSLKLGGSVQLKVDVVRTDGSVAEVTNDPKTSYFSVPPSAVSVISVTNTGLVTTAHALQYPATLTKRDTGAVIITYGARGDRDIGITKILLEVRE